MKKILVFLLLGIVFSFAQEISDTIQVEEMDSIVTDSAIVSDKITETEVIENADEVELAELTEDGTAEIIPDTIAKLTITTTPDNASILINRKRVGNSPFTANELAPEEYKIMILKEGFELFDTTITLVGGKAEKLSITLVSEKAEKNVVENTSDSAKISDTDSITTDTTAVSSDDTAKRKKKVDRIGIIVFLTIMFALVFAQEYNR